MSAESELLEVTRRLLAAIHAGDLETYRELTDEGVSCFEQDVAPYRIDGLDFHLDLMSAMREGGHYGSLVRFDILAPRVQIHGDAAVVTYTRLMTYTGDAGPSWRAFNETRVYSRAAGAWKMIHFHRSAAPV